MDKFRFQKMTVTNQDNKKDYTFATRPVDNDHLRIISLTELGGYALYPLDEVLIGSNDQRDAYAVKISEPELGIIIVVWKNDGNNAFTLNVNPDEGDESIYKDYSEGCVLHLIKEK